MRDKIKNRIYFEEYITYEENCLVKRLKLINQIIEQRGIDDSVEKAYLSILNYSINLLNSNYSFGATHEKMKLELNTTVNNNINTSLQYRYVEVLWVLSIGIMLEVEDEDFKRLVQLVEKDNPEDYLVDFLIHFRNNTWNIKHTGFKFNTPYKAIAEVISLAKTDKQEAVVRLKQYLDKEWYKGHSDMGWHDSHKSEHNIYSGYWCWEAGALVKILGLDDSSLKDQQYYPYDMVHWK